MELNETKIMVSSLLMQKRIEEAQLKQANNFKIENDTLTFLNGDEIVCQIFFSMSTPTMNGDIDYWEKWNDLAHILKAVSERPVVIHIFKRLQNDFDFYLKINI